MEAPGFYTTSPNKDQEMDERLFASTANLRRLAVDGTVCPEFGFGVAIQIRYFKVVTIYHLGWHEDQRVLSQRRRSLLKAYVSEFSALLQLKSEV